MDTTKHTQNINEIVDILTTKYSIEQIYLNTYGGQAAPFDLIILVSSKYIKNLDDLVPRVINAIRDYPQYNVMCYVAFQAKDKIREGNLFLFASCQPQKLIYKKEGSNFEPIPNKIDYASCKKLTISLREREQKKIDEFKEGYYFYMEKKNYGLASFMLHQVLELTYQYLETLLVARERLTHSIRAHHLYLNRISSVYTGVFDEEDVSDIRLLHVLEEIYRGARYDNDFRINIDTLKQLELKMETLQTTAAKVFDYIVSSFEGQHGVIASPNHQNNNLPIKTKDIKQGDNQGLNEIIEQLKHSLSNSVSIYLFGHRTRSFLVEGTINDNENTGVYYEYFDLLIVSETDVSDQVASLQAEINKRSGISILLLSYTQDQVQKQLDNNSPFFHGVLQKKDSLLYAGLKLKDWLFHENKGVRTVEELKKLMMNWYKRENNANGFFNGGKGIEASEEAAIKVLLYNQGIEQACLGLLEFFYGYIPYQHNLDHLYNLCCSFWYFPNDIFPNSNEEDKNSFNEFAGVVNNVLYNRLSYFDWDEAFRYEQRCQRFIEKCSKLVRKAISEMK